MAISTEEREKNFDRVLRKRICTIVDQLQNLTNLRNAQYYKYSDEEMEKAFAMIRVTVDNVEHIVRGY